MCLSTDWVYYFSLLRGLARHKLTNLLTLHSTSKHAIIGVERLGRHPNHKAKNKYAAKRYSNDKGDDMVDSKHFTIEEAKKIGDDLGIDWDKFDVEQFRRGLEVELEHGKRDLATNVTDDDPILTGKIALAHLNEFPDYYTRLEKMEKKAKEFHGE